MSSRFWWRPHTGSIRPCCRRVAPENSDSPPRGPRARVSGRKSCVRTWASPSLRRPKRSGSWRSELPDFPRRLAARPLFLECPTLAHGVHRSPVARVPEDGQLPVAREPFERLALEDRVRADVVERLPLEDKEATVDPSLVELRLLAEFLGKVATDVKFAETACRPHPGDRRELALSAMELEEGPQIHVGDPVAVRDHEFIAFDVPANPLDPASGLGREPGLGQQNAPLLFAVKRLEVLDAPLADVDSDVAVHRAVVEEVVADQVALVAEAEDEIHDPEVRVELHDVPEDRPAADVDHRLRPDIRLLGKTRSESTAEDHRLHGRHSTNDRRGSPLDD